MGRWLSDGWLGNVFSPAIKVEAGGGIGTLSVGGAAFVTAGLSTNVSTSATILYSYTLPPNSFNKAGQGLRVSAWGTAGGVASGTTVSVSLAVGSVNFSVANGTTALGTWYGKLCVLRSGISTQEFELHSEYNGVIGAVRQTSSSESETAGIVIKITGTSSGGGTNGNTSARGMIVEFFNA